MVLEGVAYVVTETGAALAETNPVPGAVISPTVVNPVAQVVLETAPTPTPTRLRRRQPRRSVLRPPLGLAWCCCRAFGPGGDASRACNQIPRFL